jgi:serine/threonine-protein kinase
MTTQQDPLVGHTLAGKYVIERLVREEGLGKVYDAVILPQRAPVAVKVLHPHLVEDKESFGRFGREMLATAAISHPNSVRMLDFGEHRGIFHFLVLERLWARTLTRELATLGQLPVGRSCHISAQIASVLISAHAEKIVHRNLSSDNVLLLENAITGDFVKIRDFGTSRLYDDRGQADDDISDVDTRVGSVAYMSPEYIDQGIVDPRSDLYAMGILLFQMLTGEPPFTGRPGDVLDAHVRKTPPPASEKAAVPLWLDALIATLLEKDVLLRPRNAAEVLTALQRGTGKRLDPPDLAPEGVARRVRAGEDGALTEEEEEEGGFPVVSALAVVVIVIVVVGLIAAAMGVFG